MRSLKTQIVWYRRYQYLLGAMLLVVIVFWYFGGYRLQMDREAVILAQRAHLRMQLEDGQTKAMAIPDVAKKLEKLKFALADFKALPEKADWGEFETEITQRRDQAKLRKFDMVNAHDAVKRNDEFTEMPVYLKFEGNFLSVFSFLRAVEDLPQLTRVSSLTVRGGDLMSGTVQVEMTMSIYFAGGIMSLQDQLPSFLNRLIESFRADPKKGTFMSVLLVVMVVLWGRMILGSKTPGAARAMQVATVAQSDNAVAASKAHVPVAGDSTLQAWSRKPVTAMTRNLFSVPLDYYPDKGTRTLESDSGNGGFWEQVAKSMSVKADQQEQRRILVENVRVLAASLKLESTMMGSTPSAMVNGKLVHEGNEIDGFSVKKIEARRMVVEHEGIMLEILMK